MGPREDNRNPTASLQTLPRETVVSPSKGAATVLLGDELAKGRKGVQSRNEASTTRMDISDNPSDDKGIWDAISAMPSKKRTLESVTSSDLPSAASPGISNTQELRSAQGIFDYLQKRGRLAQGQHNILSPNSRPNKQNSLGSGSATELDTASIQDLAPFGPLGPLPFQHTVSGCSQSPQQGTEKTTSESLTTPTIQISVRDLHDLTISCVKRLSVLESLSYSHVPLEEVEEKFEAFESRLINLEDFRTATEVRFPVEEDSKEAKTRNLTPASEHRSTSSSSVSSLSEHDHRSCSPALSATAAVYAEYNEHFNDIEQKVENVSILTPTMRDPWQVELVLLPWGRHLSGIWSAPSADLNEKQRREGPPRDEWGKSNVPNHLAASGSFLDRSGWSSESIRAWADDTSEWLSPRACGPSSPVWKRLWSRGLIKSIEVDACDAFSFTQKCREAFDGLIPLIPEEESESHFEKAFRSRYDALREPLIPLRKIRKVSRLGFLAPSEMVTAAVWTPTMLDSRVFMKANGVRRLYLTFSKAYTQRADDGWTWQYIRQLKPVNHGGSRTGPGFDGTDRYQDLESCWNWHSVLDASPLQVASMGHIDHRIYRTNHRRHERFEVEHDAQQSLLITHLSDTKTPQSSRVRTKSSASAGHGNISGAENDLNQPDDQFGVARPEIKRRRLSNSTRYTKPSTACTPYISRHVSPQLEDLKGQHADYNKTSSQFGGKVRTPLAYATPYSCQTHAMSARLSTETEEDTEVATEIMFGRSSPFGMEEEWQGMGDDVREGTTRVMERDGANGREGSEYGEDEDLEVESTAQLER